ncbi:helix-turn-helix domain-containing protein [Rhodococcus sp. Eu-32]|uniref:helix-turn-helix transcriptional regulator n=1 Tax=Rhodococcus sp. Eu-32 TaxID=1017319 RepID=UPI000DF11F2B|nr:helix-turn-helix domain-containing protein [Rhodococcus sp. Eu-32]RRQ29188.1 helix-turn-helix domain-containing protein [Rhodococcus sp. Eu-32]
MSTVLIDTYDLAEAEQVLSANYTKQRLNPKPGAPTRTTVERSHVGSMITDELSYSYDLKTLADPLADIVLCRVRSGLLERGLPGGHTVVTGASQTTAMGAQAELPIPVDMQRPHFDTFHIDRDLLDRVAAGPDEPGETASIRLTSEAPISPGANAYLVSVIDHIKNDVLPNPHAAASPLVAGNVANYLASAMLEVFPNTAVLEPTIEDRHDSTPALLRKAIAFIDDNAEREISLVAIAESIHVSPRALQYMFRKHLDTTPTEYLRRVRLHQAHLALVAGDRMKTTVGRVAADWGFSHLGRFAIYYRKHYGVSPHQTLRR